MLEHAERALASGGELVTVPCFVLGLFDTGLAAVRALARQGLPVYGFDSQPYEYGFLSRFGSHAVCPDPRIASQLIGFLSERAQRLSARPILFPTSDAFVMFMSENREALEPHFQFALPPHDSISAAIDKAAQYDQAKAAGLPVPPTYTPRTVEDVRMLAATLDYPVIVKPAIGHVWRERFRGDKAIRIDTADDLVRLFQQILTAGQIALIQSLVPGPNTNHCKVCAYFDQGGNPLAVICMRKIRQYPVDFGVGTLMETVAAPEVRELGLRLFRAMQWRGPGSIEFKCDERDGQWKLIELNPRLWQQHALAAACGMNFPLLQYQELTGRPQVIDRYRTGVRWMDEFRDPRSAWEHRRRDALTVNQWAQSLARVRTLALWAADDPTPFLASARHHAGRAWQRMASAPEPDLAKSR